MLGRYIWLTLREFFKIGLENKEKEEDENILIVRIARKSRDQKQGPMLDLSLVVGGGDSPFKA